MKSQVYLIGPFIGELLWEFYRFAPYMIYLKKQNPEKEFIVFTRESRFDLYGRYARILVPLKIKNDLNENQNCFKSELFLTRDYQKIAKQFKRHYKKRYEIVSHIYPDITSWRYKVRWQFPRNKMDYDFKPRTENKIIAKSIVKPNNIIIDNISIGYISNIPDVINTNDIILKITKNLDMYSATYLGCIIESIKIAKAVVSNFDSYISNLAILLKKPLICINNTCTIDSINLLNPFKTPIIFSDGIAKGIKEYEKTM